MKEIQTGKQLAEGRRDAGAPEPPGLAADRGDAPEPAGAAARAYAAEPEGHVCSGHRSGDRGARLIGSAPGIAALFVFGCAFERGLRGTHLAIQTLRAGAAEQLCIFWR